MKDLLKKLIYSIFRCMPIKKERILFFSYYGEYYSGGPKYISEYIEKNKKIKIEINWAFVNPDQKNSISENVKKIKYGGLKYYYILATAQIIITNYRMTLEFKKRENQVYFQTWHGSLALKAIEKDAQDKLTEHYIEMAQKDSKQMDYLICGNEFYKNIFEHSFWYEGNVLNIGTPQCDILVNQDETIKKKVYDHFNLSYDIKIALYAPTFRANYKTEIYKFEYEKIIDLLNEKTNDNWVLLIRLHPHLINMVDSIKYDKNILQASQYDEMQELLSVSDLLITDYSGIMFDYALTRKPCILYVPDLDEYIKTDRKLYFNVEDLPFEIARTEKELQNRIIEFDKERYKEGVNYFLKETIQSVDDGKACERIFEKIQEIIEI